MGVYENTSFSAGKAPKLGSYKVSPQLLVRPSEDKDNVELLLHFHYSLFPVLQWDGHFRDAKGQKHRQHACANFFPKLC